MLGIQDETGERIWELSLLEPRVLTTLQSSHGVQAELNNKELH